MKFPLFRFLAAAALAALATSATVLAQTGAGDVVLISNSLATVTRAEYDAELLRIPADLRAGFPNDPKRVNDLLVRMLIQKSLAAQARAARLDAKPETALRIALETDRLLSAVMMESVENAAAEEFDKLRPKYEARARELYVIDRAKFETPEQVSATHILFDPKKRGADEAKRQAQEARAKIAAGADMRKLARETSDDPSSSVNDGALGWFVRKDMDPAFADAAFALKNTGDLSQPVESKFGWHVIRLDGRRPAGIKPYDEVRETIMDELKRRYVEEKRDEVLGAIRRDPKLSVNREAIGALSPRVDPDAVKRALGTPPPGVAPVAPK